MAQQHKIDKVQELKTKLKEKKNIILTDYSGMKVSNLTELRSKLREKNVDYKVVKNNLFKLALKESGYLDIEDHIKGPIAIAFTNEEFSEAARILKDFQKEYKQFTYTLGIMENVVYNEQQIKRIADIPSKEYLYSQIMSVLNSQATGIAVISSQVIASLARAIKAVAEKNSKE